MKKKFKIIIIILALIVLITGVTAVIIRKSDWRFIAGDYCSKLFNFKKSQLTEEQIPVVGCTPEELKSDSRVTFNQSAMLINPAHTLPENFEAEVAPYKDTEVLMNTCVSDAYAQLSAAVNEKFGNKLYIMSAYRTADEQKQVSEDEEGTAAAYNASEHVAGLALDVYVMYYAGYGFIKSDVGQFVNSECWKYGFIIRYPYCGEKSTGMEYEPWHIRYVGAPHAQIIYENGLTYEEYIESLESGKFYTCGEYTVSRQNGEKLYLPAEFTSAVISGDNTGGYIVTAK